MEIKYFDIPGLVLLQPNVFSDDRGYFLESYSRKIFEQAGIQADFVQDNESQSQLGTLRGLHFQAPPFEQGKLVRVIKGAVYDVAVDIRKGSPTFGKHIGVELNDKQKALFWIPPGFAHGFYTLEQNTIFSYKCTGFYNKAAEGGLAWNDPFLKINWPIESLILSEKDKNNTNFESFDSPFRY